MFNPKPEIYAKLCEIKDIHVSQSSQNIFNEVPAVTYRIDGNSADYYISENNIASQEILCSIDIFTNDSVSASSILAQVEAKMRELKYRLNNALDIPSPEGALYHINATFVGLR